MMEINFTSLVVCFARFKTGYNAAASDWFRCGWWKSGRASRIATFSSIVMFAENTIPAVIADAVRTSIFRTDAVGSVQIWTSTYLIVRHGNTTILVGDDIVTRRRGRGRTFDRRRAGDWRRADAINRARAWWADGIARCDATRVDGLVFTAWSKGGNFAEGSSPARVGSATVTVDMVVSINVNTTATMTTDLSISGGWEKVWNKVVTRVTRLRWTDMRGRTGKRRCALTAVSGWTCFRRWNAGRNHILTISAIMTAITNASNGAVVIFIAHTIFTAGTMISGGWENVGNVVGTMRIAAATAAAAAAATLASTSASVRNTIP